MRLNQLFLKRHSHHLIRMSKARVVRTNDPLQPGYSYECTAPRGKEFDSGFAPELTPQEMLELGVFGGNYFEGEIDEYPATWFRKAKLSAAGKLDAQCNYFGVNASQDRSVWEANGWIYKDDPRGWFQWYCRYYLGRRLPKEDRRQIERWQKIVRHLAQIKYNCRPGDITCRPRQKQAVLHWAYNSTKL